MNERRVALVAVHGVEGLTGRLIIQGEQLCVQLSLNLRFTMEKESSSLEPLFEKTVLHVDSNKIGMASPQSLVRRCLE